MRTGMRQEGRQKSAAFFFSDCVLAALRLCVEILPERFVILPFSVQGAKRR
jgi:hypothetical protein